MNSYNIIHKVKSLVDLFEPLDINGFHIYPYKNGRQDYFFAEKQISSDKFNNAYKIFLDEISSVLDALSVFNQASIDLNAESVLTKKSDSLYAYFHFTRPTETIGMSHLNEDNKKIEIMLDNRDKMALSYMRQANNTYTPYGRLSALLIVIESLAGYIEAKECNIENCPRKNNIIKKTDTKNLKVILGGKLYEKLYLGENPIRHILFHGHKISMEQFTDLLEPVYNKIIDYYNKQYNLEIQRIVQGPRAFYNSYESGKYFLKFNNDQDINFERIEQKFEESNDVLIDNQEYSLVKDQEELNELLKNF